ncbi:MAG: hypothetical protein ACFFD6_11215, partial [Candidatus Thorarchaeota archaeon]
ECHRGVTRPLLIDCDALIIHQSVCELPTAIPVDVPVILDGNNELRSITRGCARVRPLQSC